MRKHIVVLLMAGACVSAGCGSKGNPAAPTGPPAPGSAINFSAVGASDALGVGSSAPCAVPWSECPEGMGYVQVAARQLKAQGFTVISLNLGLPTAVIGPDFQALGQQYGRETFANFIDHEMAWVQQNATVVTIFAGGNDVNTITAALGGGAGASDQAAYVDQQVRAFGADFEILLDGIRSRAGSARIIALNLPNLAGLPYLAGALSSRRQAAQRAAVGMTTTVINPLIGQGITVVDLMCDERWYLGSNTSSDGFHPNDSGYAFIASEVIRAITSAPYPSPKASCAQMVLVP